jgi:hypothetical protein
MIRMSAVTDRENFYDVSSKISDADKVCELLTQSEFAFVHRVLSFVRQRDNSLSDQWKLYGVDAASRRILLEKYGRKCLSEQEFASRRRVLRNRHNRVLGEALLTLKPRTFWQFHRLALNNAGLRIGWIGVLGGAFVTLIRYLFNVESSLRSLWRALRDRAK